MLRTPLVHRVTRPEAVWPVVLLAVAVAVLGRDIPTQVLDLTAPPPREEREVSGSVGPGAPGRSIGSFTPRPYAIPLAIQLKSVSPQHLVAEDNFTVEVVITNNGSSTYYLPASQETVTVNKGNKGRRTFLFSLVIEDPAGEVRFEDPPGSGHNAWFMASSHGSDSVPDSFLPIEPGHSVRVLFRANLERIRSRLTPELKQFRLRAHVSEWKYEDRRYFIENTALPVVSDNAVTIELAH